MASDVEFGLPNRWVDGTPTAGIPKTPSYPPTRISMTNSNQREFTRVPSGMEVDLKFDDGTEIAGLLDNISMRGLFVPSDHTMPEGSVCDVTIFLGGRGHGLALKMKGQVTRCTDGGIGIRFDEIPYDTFQHLQKIVLFSSGNSGVIESELESHLGLGPRD
jgi:hypothetical protein